jgi:hypothetical protein
MMTTSLKQRFRKREKGNAALGLPADFHVAFGSCYAYSPQGLSETSERSRLLCTRVKNGRSGWLRTYAARVREQALENECLSDLFNPNAVLVPIPKCRQAPGPSVWVANKLAVAINATGLGQSVWAGLRRMVEVERSSSAWVWGRPTVQQHFQSFAVIPPVTIPTEIVLIDDVVTKGRTLLAAAFRLQQSFPQARIGAFALVRTLGLIPDVRRVFDPCRGEIRWDGRDAQREP